MGPVGFDQDAGASEEDPGVPEMAIILKQLFGGGAVRLFDEACQGIDAWMGLCATFEPAEPRFRSCRCNTKGDDQASPRSEYATTRP